MSLKLQFDSSIVTEKDILPIIKQLYSSKSGGFESLSIRMINICSQSATAPVKINFNPPLKMKLYSVLENIS